MLRVFPALIGTGLAAIWVIGMSVDATVWMTWGAGLAAPLAVATVGLVPARRGSVTAAISLGLIAAGLFVLSALGLRTNGTPWLAWWIFVAACLTGLVAIGVACQGAVDALRTRPGI